MYRTKNTPLTTLFKFGTVFLAGSLTAAVVMTLTDGEPPFGTMPDTHVTSDRLLIDRGRRQPIPLPPFQLFNDSAAVVHTHMVDPLQEVCAMRERMNGSEEEEEEEEGIYLGCASVGLDSNRVMDVLNPCYFRHETYGALLCHEFGHINGWGPGHPTQVEWDAMHPEDQEE